MVQGFSYFWTKSLWAIDLAQADEIVLKCGLGVSQWHTASGGISLHCNPIIQIAALLAVICASSAAFGETIDRIAAVVGDDIITMNDLRKEGELRYAIKGKDLRDIDRSPNRAEELEALTLEIVRVRLVNREARNVGIHVGEREVDMQLQQMYRASGQSEEAFRAMIEREGVSWASYRAYIRSEIEMQQVVRAQLSGQVAPSEADVIACAREKAPDAENSITSTIRQILIPELGGDSSVGLAAPAASTLNAVWWNNLDNAMLRYAHGIQEIVANDPTHFVDYVKKYSTGRSVERDGMLGSFSPTELSKEFAPVFALEAGQVSDIIGTASGYHIVYVDEVKRGESEKWTKAMDVCREVIIARESQRLVASWLNDLMEKYYVSILVNENIADDTAP